MFSSSKKQTGFTLLETLVAFSIFAMSLGVLLQIYSKGSRAARYGEQFAVATMIAQSKLAGIGYLDELDSNETSGEENDTYRWTLRSEPIEEDYPELELNHHVVKHRVEVEVSWGNVIKTHRIKLVTMKLISSNDS